MNRFGLWILHIDAKPDNTPVTDADRAVERAIRNKIASPTIPSDSIW